MRTAIVLASLLLGCKSNLTPQSVCARQTEIMAKEFAGQIPAREQAESNAKCVAFLTKLQVENPAQWQCRSACVLAAKEVKDTMACGQKCQ